MCTRAHRGRKVERALRLRAIYSSIRYEVRILEVDTWVHHLEARSRAEALNIQFIIY